ncbi:MAG TPA: hypothetical protein VJ011_04375 [Steroidobacteraceae bacterium]|nr:hypothetical protein [Steroidobacteraceae bacterium]
MERPIAGAAADTPPDARAFGPDEGDDPRWEQPALATEWTLARTEALLYEVAARAREVC